MTKVSIVGGGNGGCFTALFLSWFEKDLEVELIYNPEILPERVGQATTLEPPKLCCGVPLDLIGTIILYMLPLKVVYCMRGLVNIMKNYFMTFLQVIWQCIIVRGNYNHLF